jgi:hypothetical protein
MQTKEHEDMRHVLTVSAAIGGAALVGLAWFGSSQAQVQQFQAVTMSCIAGFTASGTANSYTCTSAPFKCRAGMTVFVPSIVGGNRARYTCAYPAG